VRAVLLAAALIALPALADKKKAESSPVPERFGFNSANLIDGKVGLGTWFSASSPLGARTGYGTFFGQLDWDGVQNTNWGVHLDFDGRLGLLYEGLDPTVFVDGQPEDAANPLTDAQRTYRRPLTFLTGRTYDYLRIETLYGSYETEDWGVRFGRTFVRPAASAQVDGIDAFFNFGRAGRVGVFGGLKPNPWHQQVVGATAGGWVFLDGQFQRPFWHTLAADESPNPDVIPGNPDTKLTEGAGSNNLYVTSTQFITGGLYGTLRLTDVFADASMGFDLFNGNVDRAYLYTNAGWRASRSATLNFRGTLDVIGARPLNPRDVVLDFTWRDLGPARFSASYTKINTFATAASYGVFFRPLENNVVLNGANTPVIGDPNLDLYFDDANGVSIAAGVPLNNAQIFLVDRDKLAAEVAVTMGEDSTFETYATGFIERRGDVAWVENAPLDFGAVFAGVSNVFAAPCQAAPGQVVGINPAIPVHEDLCRIGVTLGIRDPFLGGAGSFDIHASHINGFFSTTNSAGGSIGAGLGDAAWFELGGGMETTDYHRLWSSFDPDGDGTGQGQFLSGRANAFLMNATASWNIWNGIIVEGSYFGFIEDVPFIGDTRPGFGNIAQQRDTAQATHSLFARALYRF
jgi:hypothetical protein